MINLYHNPELPETTSTYNNMMNIKVKNNKMIFTLEYTDINGQEKTEIKELELSSYFSWIYMQNLNEPYITKETGKLYYENNNAIFPLIRFTYSYRLSYQFVHNFLKGEVLLQVDTGVISDSYKEISIRLIGIPKEHCTIETEDEIIEVDTMKRSEVQTKLHPKNRLWPNYGLLIDDTLYKYRVVNRSIEISSNLNIPIKVNNREYIDIDIIKHDASFENTLERDFDNEKLEASCSCGLINATCIYLNKGQATIRLYPFGYRGPFKFKLGWRWYPALNDYELTLID